MFNDIKHWITDNQQACLANATEVTEYVREAIHVRSLVFQWTWTRKSMVSHVPEQTKRSMGSYCQEKDRNLKKLHIRFFLVLNHP